MWGLWNNVYGASVALDVKPALTNATPMARPSITIKTKASSFALAKPSPSNVTLRGCFKRRRVSLSINRAILITVLKSGISPKRTIRQNGIIPQCNKVPKRDYPETASYYPKKPQKQGFL
jgi:hypothetical protein